MFMSWITEFLCVARKMNITAAARELNMSQPNLSRHLKQLEAELGFPLFVTKNRRIHLTTAGKHFLDNAAIMNAKFMKMIDDCRDLAASEIVPLQVKEPPYNDKISQAYLAFLNKELNRENRYHLIFLSELTDLMPGAHGDKSCDVDIAYLTKTQVNNAILQGNFVHELGRVHLGVWVGEETPFAFKESLDLSDLAQITLGFPNNTGHPLRDAYISLMKEAGFEPNYCEFQCENRLCFIDSAPPECGFILPADSSNDYRMQWRGDLVYVPLQNEVYLTAYALSKVVDFERR